MSSEALRLADELDHLDYDDSRRVAAFLREQAVARALDTFGHNVMVGQARLQMICLENKLQNVEAERDTLRAEVERLRPNALRYEWLRDVKPVSVPFDSPVEPWVYSRPAASDSAIDTAIDRAIEAAKEA